MKVLSWFSNGAASAVATKLALGEYGDVTIYTTDPGSEHPDNARFAEECATWFGREVNRITGGRYVDTWDVWESTGYLVGPTGARCTVELKKRARWKVERDYDAQVFGYTAEEAHRADRFRAGNPDVRLITPLIDRGLTKADCLAMIERAGIELPAMYRLGFNNNNCIGCVKGGMGYWNHIRVVFPDTFARMAALERKIGHAILHDDDGLVWLDELDPTRGELSEPMPDCSLLCELATADLEAAP